LQQHLGVPAVLLQVTRGRTPCITEGNCRPETLLCSGRLAALILLLLLLFVRKAADLPAAPELDMVMHVKVLVLMLCSKVGAGY
jgi:hypothetical protein